jgi:serine O-acetyltransferase
MVSKKFSLKLILRHDMKKYCEIMNIDSDFTGKVWRQYFSFRFLPILILRISQFFYNKKLYLLSKFFFVLNFLFFRCEIPASIPIGGGFFMPHPNGVILGAASVGNECIIYQSVTIGAKFLDNNLSESTRPIIEDDVVIGSNSVIIGPLVVKSGSRVRPLSYLR